MNYTLYVLLLAASLLLLGAVAGVLGCYAVLRRRALVGDLVSHAALPGLALAVLVLGRQSFVAMLIGAFITGLLGIVAMTLITRTTRTKEDAALGIVLGVFFGAGIVLSGIIARLPGIGAKAGLESYIFGQTAGMSWQDVYLIGGASAICLFSVVLLYKEFKLLSFDPGFARAQGWPTLALDMIMMGSLALITVVGLPAVGAVLMAAMLIMPAATARFWTNRLGPMLVLAAIIGSTSAGLGALFSSGVIKEWLGFEPLAFGDVNRNLPAGPLIVLSGTTLFLLSVFFAPRRGIIGRMVLAWRLRRKTARENLLRTLYEINEPSLPERVEVSREALLERRAWSRWQANALLRRAGWAGLIETTAQGVRLTDAGVDAGERLVRVHRLWELYLIRGVHIAPDHVDRDADAIEHLLTPEIVDQLENKLAAEGVLAAEQSPASPHEPGDVQMDTHAARGSSS